jgi:flagellar L-ring protein FlgH
MNYSFSKFAAALLLLAFATSSFAKTKVKTSQQARSEYLEHLQQETVSPADQTQMGSLWSANAPLAQIGSDVKARNVNDSIIIRVSVNTNAQQSGSANSQRAFQTSSAITGLAGQVSVAGVNPILNANSSTQLKGTGQTASNSNLQTNLAGQVIAVLPNGNLVVEAQREIYMNNQKETAVVRGVARPTDIDSFNSIPSSALNNLQVELKGKGIISDSTRPPNILTRFLLKIIGF